ncbi:glycogen synthase GlgA [Bacillus sp. FJAT-45350]|uniref:glycogen synthase GlgA n=1 Tax=Bacillus sp. FJAT-45350 TaxID=2011014 RepID=UPI000BB78F6B|nr:glycogen synthase GlgA [Bacillus sp. FJAT-45350]
MKVLFVASECTPFMKTGGLADVIGSLPKALQKLHIDVRVILPKFDEIPQHFKEKMTYLKEINVPVGWRNQYCGIQELQHENITYYFIDNEYYFKRPGLYGYYDEAERFVYFCHAVIEGIKLIDFQPDVIHCHDWQTALIPSYLRTVYSEDSFYKQIKTMFTIHNLAYQGIFSKSIYQDMLHFAPEHYFGIEYNGDINFLKGALVHSDVVTTVSETYAHEIKTPYFGEGLDSLLKERSIYGIVNGIDYDEFNPGTDQYLTHHFTHSVQDKRKNKLELQKELGLPVSEQKPMIALVSRLVEQKGLPLITSLLDEIASFDIQFVILGTGDKEFEQAFQKASTRYPTKISTQLFFNEKLARKIYAASDMFLMPSRFEPCGIGQLIALRYESVPIVRETGGLNDTIKSFCEFSKEGNGFTFTNYNAHDMLHTIKRALHFYEDEVIWSELLQNIYRTNFSWDNSANQYKQLYVTNHKEW